MSRFYSRVPGRRHRLAVIAIAAVAGTSIACAAPKTTSNEPVPAESVQSLLDQAHNAERERQYHEARALYLRAIEQAPDRTSAAIANREMASALVFWGEYEGARVRLLASLEHDDQQARVWHDLGMVQEHLGDREAAVASLRKATDLAPSEPRSRISYAALLVKQEQFAEALTQYEALLKLPVPDRIEAATREAIRLLKSELARSP